jgi:2-octaprenyl-6-methoxyphenol hydroxylase
MHDSRVLIVGAGPVGLALALMLAKRSVPSTLVDARTLESAQADRRLLALSRGTVDLLAPLVALPAAAVAPIGAVIVSSAGEFGRVTIGAEDLGPRPLGVTIRYGDLLGPLAAACAASALIEVQRPCRVVDVAQKPAQVQVTTDGGATHQVPLLVNAEGSVTPGAPATQRAVVADVVVDGPPPGHAYERFTREGPLALLPLPGGGTSSGRTMALVWCMPAGTAQRRMALTEPEFRSELQQAFGQRNGRIVSVGARAGYDLHPQARDAVREHRVVWIGNAAQTLHPVAGQGLNLGMRDASQLADLVGQAMAQQRELASVLGDYAEQRRLDRTAIRSVTRSLPALFTTRAEPVALGRSLALAVLNVLPDARRQFARLLMFGVRN